MWQIGIRVYCCALEQSPSGAMPENTDQADGACSEEAPLQWGSAVIRLLSVNLRMGEHPQPCSLLRPVSRPRTCPIDIVRERQVRGGATHRPGCVRYSYMVGWPGRSYGIRPSRGLLRKAGMSLSSCIMADTWSMQGHQYGGTHIRRCLFLLQINSNNSGG